MNTLRQAVQEYLNRPPHAALGIVAGFPVMLVSVHASDTASVGTVTRAVWTLAAFVVWGIVLGWSEQRLIEAERTTDALDMATAATEPPVERIDRRRFLIRLGGTTAAITVAGAVVGEIAESRKEEAVMMARGEMLWSATHLLPNADAAVKPAPGTRPELTPLDRFYRIDINTIPPKAMANNGD